MRILIVEDVNLSGRILQYRLKQLGFADSTVVSSAEEALEILGKEAFDVIFADCELPQMNGPELIRQVRSDRGDEVIILVVSGNAEPHHVLEAMEAGADYYIVKPATSEVLREKVGMILGYRTDVLPG